MTRNNELEGVRKEAVVAKFTIPFRHLLEEDEEKLLKPSVTIVGVPVEIWAFI
jgi:hypothetical protein